MATTTVTKKQLATVAKDVREIVRSARQRLFELETLQYLREIQDGHSVEYDSMADFWARRKAKHA